MVLGEVKRTFNPEFINRIDETIVFEALSDDDLRTIPGLLVHQPNANLADRRLKITMTPEVADWIIEATCKDRHFGTQRALGLHLDGAVDDAQQATRMAAVSPRQWRQLHPQEARGNSLPVAKIKIAGEVFALEKAVQQIGDLSRLQAIRVAPVEGGAICAADHVAETAVEQKATWSSPAASRSTIAAAIGRASSKPVSSAATRCGVAINLSDRRCPETACGRRAAACM